jgi:rieske iron-sulfur protein
MGGAQEGSSRRTVLRAALGLGLGVPVLGVFRPLTRGAGAQGVDPASARPQAGDRFVFVSGDRARKVVTSADLSAGGPPVVAFPLEPTANLVRDGSRLNQVLLLRCDGGDLPDDVRAADGVVAYSGVCTHAGCDVTVWRSETRMFKCPCHESQFDPRDNGRVVGGPAPRRLPRLPIKLVDGVPVATGGFLGRPGFQGGG